MDRDNYADWVVYIKTSELWKFRLHQEKTADNQDIYRYEDEINVSSSDIHDNQPSFSIQAMIVMHIIKEYYYIIVLISIIIGIFSNVK